MSVWLLWDPSVGVLDDPTKRVVDHNDNSVASARDKFSNKGYEKYQSIGKWVEISVLDVIHLKRKGPITIPTLFRTSGSWGSWVQFNVVVAGKRTRRRGVSSWEPISNPNDTLEIQWTSYNRKHSLIIHLNTHETNVDVRPYVQEVLLVQGSPEIPARHAPIYAPLYLTKLSDASLFCPCSRQISY